MDGKINSQSISLDVAVIGMAGRFPGAENLDEFWFNLKNGVESVKTFTDEELIQAGVRPETLRNPQYVRRSPVLKDIAGFDAQFFHFSPGEAQLLDPQRRLFLECGWEAFENAGYNTQTYDGAIGVYAGAGFNGYLIYNLARSNLLGKDFDEQQVLISSDKDHLPTHLSYKLNLTGPSINVNTACSSSLVAIHMARQALLLGECDIALAGGAAVTVPHDVGYIYRQDSLLSPDGHCRAFDAKAKGTIWGSGCGAVVLKLLDRAIADGDHIYAVIKGSAINNDGADKAGFTAPSVNGQTAVVVEALAASGVTADSISYVEAHGTGTSLGDPIELEALTQAYRQDTNNKGYCRVGSIKPNIGHLGAAAGVASFIKTVLALHHQQLPPSINYDEPNPKIDFENSPFIVGTRLEAWEGQLGPRRAGISSLAVGGTNAHVVLEEAPALTKRFAAPAQGGGEYILPLSALNGSAIETMLDNLAKHLSSNPDLSIADVAFTLQEGRASFRRRVAIRCQSLKEAVEAIKRRDPKFLFTSDNTGKLSDSPDDAVLVRWLDGESVDWSSLRKGKKCRRVPLPTYAFQRQSFWVKADESVRIKTDDERVFGKLDSISKMLSTPAFKQVPLPVAKSYTPKTRLVFLGPNEIGPDVAKRMEARGDTLVYVKMADDFMQLDHNTFTVNPVFSESYLTLIRTLKAQGRGPDSVMHFWNVAPSISLPKPPSRFEAFMQKKMFTPGPISDFMQKPAIMDMFKKWYGFLGKEMPGHPVMDFSNCMDSGYFSMMWLMQALIKENFLNDIELIFFTTGVFDITGKEELDPTRNMLLSLSIVAQQEYLNFKCRVVDITMTAPGSLEHEQLVNHLEEDVVQAPDELATAYRGGRFIRYYQQTPVPDDYPRQQPVKKGGLYLVHNGLIGVGKEITRYMLDQCGAKVLITSDFFFPEEKDWSEWFADKKNDPEGQIGLRIQGIQELQKSGAIFLGPLNQLYDKRDMLKRIAYYEQQYGPIKGIMHSPGANVTGLMQFIGAMDRQTSAYHIGVIGYSLLVLDDLFKDRDLDFRVITSSLGSVLGAQAAANYGGSSSFNVAYAVKHKRTSRQPWVVHSWDTVDAEWDTVETELKEIVDLVKDRLEEGVLNVQECVDIFERCFALSDVQQVVICSNDLDARYDRWVKMKDFRGKDGKSEKMKLESHPRPELDVEYVAPRDALEEKVAAVFAGVLGLDKVGIHDDFSDLGGHSLLATQLVTDIREAFQRDIGMMPILESPTVAGLAQHIRETENDEALAV